MPSPSLMPFPSFEAFYDAEHPRLVAWLQRHHVVDAEAVAQQAFVQVFKSKPSHPEAWTRAFVFKTVRGILHKRGVKENRLVIQSLDAELAPLDGDGETLAAQIPVHEPREHEPAIDARLARVKHELRRLPPRMRAAFAIPTIYGRSNDEAARILARSVTRIDHLRSEARDLIGATFGGGKASELVATLFRPEPEPDAIETPIRPRPVPALGDDGDLTACLARPSMLESPPPCFAIVHVSSRNGRDAVLVASEPCPVEWRVGEDGHWHARLHPRFDKAPGAGAELVGLWLFEGDWLAGA